MLQYVVYCQIFDTIEKLYFKRLKLKTKVSYPFLRKLAKKSDLQVLLTRGTRGRTRSSGGQGEGEWFSSALVKEGLSSVLLVAGLGICTCRSFKMSDKSESPLSLFT